MTRFLNRLTLSGVIALIASIGLFIFTLKNIFVVLTPAVDLYETSDWSQINTKTHVSTNVDFVYDYFYYKYDEDTGKETSRAYMIPNIVEDGEGITIKEYIGVMVNSSDGYEKYDAAVEKSLNWWYMLDENAEFPEPTIELDGYVRKMNNEEKDFLIEYIAADFGISVQEAEEYVCPYMIMPYDSSGAGRSLLFCGIFFVVGLVLTGIGVLIGLKR